MDFWRMKELGGVHHQVMLRLLLHNKGEVPATWTIKQVVGSLSKVIV